MIIVLVARLRRALHWWSCFFKVWGRILTGLPVYRGQLQHHTMTSWDNARPWWNNTIDLSCSCGRVFWTREGCFTSRPTDWHLRKEWTEDAESCARVMA